MVSHSHNQIGRKSSNAARRTAFTLIELLVVVSIIALLVSILLPALSRAREQAKVTVCLAHEHQLSLAALLYAEDNQDNCPSTFWSGSEYPYAVTSGSAQGMVYMGLGLLYHYEYVGDGSVFFCPGIKASSPLSSENNFEFLDKPNVTFSFCGYCYRCSTYDRNSDGFDASDITPSAQYQGLRLPIIGTAKAMVADYFLHGAATRSPHVNTDGIGVYNVVYTDGSAHSYRDNIGAISGIQNGYGYGHDHSTGSTSHVRAWIELFDAAY